MTKIPGEVEPPKPITSAEREARKAFRQVDAEMAMTEQAIAEKAFSNNRERLKAERLAREASQRQLLGAKPTKPLVASPIWTSMEDAQLRAMAISGKSAAQIAADLKRSEAGIRGRAFKLNVLLGKRKPRGSKA